jgi:peptidoglycan/LPS O-acetylase OafA/YrhL
MPYVIWSAIFLVSKIVVFTLGHQPDRLQQLLQDPLSIVFLGGASYHLYFLPLLFTGTMLLLIPLLSKLETSKYSLLFFSVLCILLYDLLEVSENNFQLGKNIAFENLLSSWGLAPEQYPLLRLVAVAVAWLVRCLPYLFVALTLRQFLRGAESLYSGFACVGCAFAFILTSTVGGLFLPGALQELALAYTLLLFSLSLSHYLTAGSIASFAASAGACSFGIYLIHPFVMNVVKPLVGKILPGVTVSISIASMLLLSIPCFLISWLVVALLRRNKLMAKYLFGT